MAFENSVGVSEHSAKLSTDEGARYHPYWRERFCSVIRFEDALEHHPPTGGHKGESTGYYC